MSQVEEKKETDNEASAAKAESKNYQSVDNVDFSSKSAIMNSPRSLEACKMLGVDPIEMYYIPFEEFKERNPDMKKLPSDLQQYRYDQFEKFRNETIAQVKEARQGIIDGEKEKAKSKNASGETRDESPRDEKMDRLLEEEKKAIWISTPR